MEAAIPTKRIPVVLSWLVLIFGLLVYLGWAAHSAALASILPNQATMKANTALCFILLGAALVLHQQPSLRKQRAARLLASLVCLLALLTLAQFLFKINLGIDEFPFVDDMGSVTTDAPGRMSASTAISLSLISLTVIMEKAWSEKARRFILVLVQIISLSVFLSFPFSLAFGDSIFLYFGMALSTSLLMVFATLVLLLQMEDRGWMDRLIAPTPHGAATRRLLATVLLVPFMLGWLIYYGEDRGWYAAAISRSTYTITAMLLLGFIVITSAERMYLAAQAQRALEINLDAVSRQLNSLIENSPSAISIKDVAGLYQMVNSQFSRLVQLPTAAIIGQEADAVFKEPLLEGVLENEIQALLTRRPASAELSAVVDGVERTYLNLKFPLFNDADELLGLGGIWIDITDQKKLEDDLRSKNLDLERSNKELEQFAYVASHDLQEPLRMVSSYMQLLESRYRDKLDDDAREFIGFAVDGASRMQRLIQDLLAFSRVGTRGRDPEVVQSGSVLEEALQNLSMRIKENEARIEYGSLPAVFVDRNQFTQVFQNLVGNAIKFRAERQPIVAINAVRDGEHYLFSVQDNGIGFNQKHAERIFVIFQRLNSREEYEGTGIGLAICKKIIERHGGRIWVESTPGQGTTFYFTLPAEPDPKLMASPEAEPAEGDVAAPAAEGIEQRARRLI